MTTKASGSNSLLVIILDVSPVPWGLRQLKRDAQDQQRAAAGRRSVGPAVLPEVLASLQAFCLAATSIERSSGLILLAVCDNESAVVHPRKDQLQTWLQTADSYTADTRKMQEDLLTGVAELCQRAARKASVTTKEESRQAGMAAAVSKALCLINRFHVAAQTGYGISALETAHYMERNSEEGVIAMMGKSSSSSSSGATVKGKAATKSAWSPRILLVQASEDRSNDYNAFMNCAFASAKHNVVIDGCFLTAKPGDSSSFLEQACDLTGGVFLAPSGAAQVGGALTEVLFAVFLAPLVARPHLNLPALHKVDFRARCFETGDTVDMAFVCNQCLSIFKNMPTGPDCPTCQAPILSKAKRAAESSS